MAMDPVCGMQVDEASAQWTSEFEGKTFYFCAPGCKNSFDDDPMKYLGAEGSSSGHEHSSGH
jgi:YHS domain-containing protein